MSKFDVFEDLSIAISIIYYVYSREVITFHQQVLFDIGTLVVAVVVRVVALKTICNPKYYARRQQGRRRRQDENEDDEHGDKDNEDDDDDPKMPA